MKCRLSPCSIHTISESESHSVTSDSLRPQGLYSPWNSPGQNTRVGSLSLPGDLPNPGIEPRSPILQADSLPAEPHGKPSYYQSFLEKQYSNDEHSTHMLVPQLFLSLVQRKSHMARNLFLHTVICLSEIFVGLKHHISILFFLSNIHISIAPSHTCWLWKTRNIIPYKFKMLLSFCEIWMPKRILSI